MYAIAMAIIARIIAKSTLRNGLITNAKPAIAITIRVNSCHSPPTVRLS